MKRLQRIIMTASIITLLLASFSMAGQGGPDQTGYRWVDSDEAWGPEYEWVDISEVGTLINGFGPPTALGPFDIGFDFPFYGNSCDTFWVGSYGYLSFSSSSDVINYSPIPNDSYFNNADNFIALFWNRYLGTYAEGEVYYYHDDINNRFIVSFSNIPYPFLGSSEVNFQVILYPDGSILLQYGTMEYSTYSLNFATIGIENSDGSDGLEVVFNDDYIHDNMAVLIYPEPLFDYDVAPKCFTAPYGVLQVPDPFTPAVTFDNMGGQDVGFNVNLTITYDDTEVYNENVSVESLESYATTNIEFPEYTPSVEGVYTLTAVSLLETDENAVNDTITHDFEIWSEHLPPSELTAINSQDNVAPLYWFEPGMPACTLVVYDDGVASGGGITEGIIFGQQFDGIAPMYLCTTYVHVCTAGDSNWPWPFPIHTEGDIKIFVDADADGVPDTMLVNVTGMPEYGEWITHVFEPPLVIESDKFWVTYNMIEENYPPCDLLCGDASQNYFEKAWYCDANDVWYNTRYTAMAGGDYMIRASYRTHTANTMLTDIVETVFTGYNIYRSAEPNVPIEEENKIVELTTDLSYNDENVTNGITYYYVVTAVYDTDEGTVESVASNEVAITPAQGGQLSASESEIVVDTLPGDIYTEQLILSNDGDLDVEFNIAISTTTSTLAQYMSAIGDPDDYKKYDDNGLISFAVDFDTVNTGVINELPVIANSGGPDDYGYFWIDSDDPHGPEYAWIDPTLHNVLDTSVPVNGPLDMAFDFPFYGNTFNSFYVCKYGYISFTNDSGYPYDYQLPSEFAPENMIAPFWDIFDESPSDEITWYSDSSMTVITWSGMVYWYSYPELDLGLGTDTFQLVLFPDGRILFQYHTIDGPPACNTVGIQNGTQDVGVCISSDRIYARSGLATLIYKPWVYPELVSGTVTAGSNLTVDVTLDATSLENLLYQGNLYITASDVNGDLEPIDIPVSLDLATGIDDDKNGLPTDYALAQNYPNPFNAQTSIEFALEQASDVELCVYNTLGQKIATLVSGRLAAGAHTVNWDASEVSSGIYFYKIQTDVFTDTKKMLLLK